MSRIHFLNVNQGDCSIIEHNSGHVSVIDVCNATPTDVAVQRSALRTFAEQHPSVRGDFNQREHLVNPIAYLREHNIRGIWRYILTHPDMDHMDGIKALFDEYPPVNFWDTDNNKEMDASSWATSPYNQEDWELYKALRDINPRNDPKRLALLCGASGSYYNQNENGDSGGDGIQILAPTQQLIDDANESGDYNDCSYVLLYRTNSGRRIVFSGDSHDDTWEHILNTHKSDVSDIDLLIAPHHGRSSSRSYKFLDVLKPKLTLFGYARSEHLAYGPWHYRGLPIVTNNQANCMVVDISSFAMRFYVTNEVYAKAVNTSSEYDFSVRAWFVCDI